MQPMFIPVWSGNDVRAKESRTRAIAAPSPGILGCNGKRTPARNSALRPTR
jgi:hypothetical protein